MQEDDFDEAVLTAIELQIADNAISEGPVPDDDANDEEDWVGPTTP